jgi:RNA polymerase sigma-70 factor (ECF subfamily)
MGASYSDASPAGEPSYRPGSAPDFDRLYRASYPRLVRTLTALLRDAAAAEDCVQEAFVRAFKAWPRWRPDAPAEAWLHRIALNVAASHRRYQRLRDVGEVLRRFGRPELERDPAAVVERSDLLDALRRLPPRQAAAIVLRHYHGYTNREIAAALGVPERTVASRLAAARERLQQELGPAWNPEMGTSQESGVIHSA